MAINGVAHVVGDIPAVNGLVHMIDQMIPVSIHLNLRIGSCLACVYRVMNACGKFGEHKRSVRVA